MRQTKYASAVQIWDWDLIFGRAVKAISSPGVRSPCSSAFVNSAAKFNQQQNEYIRPKLFETYSSSVIGTNVKFVASKSHCAIVKFIKSSI
jgi:hypothetical protein